MRRPRKIRSIAEIRQGLPKPEEPVATAPVEDDIVEFACSARDGKNGCNFGPRLDEQLREISHRTCYYCGRAMDTRDVLAEQGYELRLAHLFPNTMWNDGVISREQVERYARNFRQSYPSVREWAERNHDPELQQQLREMREAFGMKRSDGD